MHYERKPNVKITIMLATVLLCAGNRTRAQQTDKDDGLKERSDGYSVNKDLPGDSAKRALALVASKISAKAFTHMDREDVQAAETLFLKAYATDFPDGSSQAETLLGLAELCASERRYSESASYFQALYLLPQMSDTQVAAVTHMEYALTLAGAERWPEAVHEYDQALVRIVIGIPAYLEAVKALETARNQAEPGVQHLSRFPENAMPQEEMFQYLPPEWSVRLYADRPRYDTMKAITHRFIGTHGHHFRYQPASVYLAHLRDSIGYDSKNAFAYYAYGIQLNKARRYQDARNAFVKAKQLAGSNGDVAQRAESGLQQANAGIKTAKQRL